MKRSVCIIVVVCFCLLTGCRGLYEGFKLQKAEDCYRLNYPDQEQCLQQVDVSYEEYEKERTGTKPKL